MTQDSANIPQADRLQDVVKTVVAVSQGNTSYQAIATFIGKVERQGRYYRRAAELLGFVTNERNYAKLLPAGHKLLRLKEEQPGLSQDFLRRTVMDIPVVKATFDFIQQQPGVTNAELSDMLNQDFGLAEKSMSDRRVQTILAWLKELNLVSGSAAYSVVGEDFDGADERAVLQAEELDEEVSREGTGYTLSSQPTAPKLRELAHIWSGERTKAIASSSDALSGVEKLVEEEDEEKEEEIASIRHQALVRKLADSLRGRGVEPQYNRHIDLYTEIGDSTYLCEMKSCDQDNLVAQARRGLAQLYEYSYIHQLNDTNLVLVLEVEPLSSNRWYTDYLVNDRGILVCWATSSGKFAFPATCAEPLHSLIGS